MTPTSALTDHELVSLISMWRDFDQDLSDFEKALADEVMVRFHGTDRAAFRLTANERAALEPVWDAIEVRARLDDIEAA
ncbi:hypothetical protein GVN21_16740 [Caulobacter sp. SLTY]|uniref:hypothetical protein n=1 Tax=Caulobacter sp. SLTY TaxID=2683262 RepID=UPI001413632B|nr:hypothetical protein [Caulobacter sp. SLTY]NBB17015.1 hypothetical protein [Caulobacter sp. SLTY]